MKAMPKVIFLDTAHPDLMDGLEKIGYECIPQYNAGLEELLPILNEAYGLVIRSRIPLNKDLLDAAPALHFVARVGAGMENIDIAYAQQRGIILLNAPEGNRDAVGEHTCALLLAVMNHIPGGDKEVREGLWRREANRGAEIKGKTVAIIGYGNTGSAFAKRLSGFDARVIAYDKYKEGFSDEFVKEVNMEVVFREADILSLHVPLSEETHYLVNDAYIASFKKNIWLLNTSRGAVLETAALIRGLERGSIKGAALDVLEYEKKSFESLDAAAFPESFRTLVQRENVVLSPHVAGWTSESLRRLATVLLAKIDAITV